jgi:predicted metalloprotease with PDZ domain
MSYYNKGAVIAMLLDLEIINDSKATKSLDDVMKYMYDEFYKVKKRGYTDAEFKTALEKFAGRNLDDFYNKYVYGVDSIDYDKYVGYAGYKLNNTLVKSTDAFLGTKTVAVSGRHVITAITRNSPAWVAGLSVNDEIVTLADNPVADVDKFIATKKPGDKITIVLYRDGILMDYTVTLSKNPQIKYAFSELDHVSPEALAVRKKWMKLE